MRYLARTSVVVTITLSLAAIALLTPASILFKESYPNAVASGTSVFMNLLGMPHHLAGTSIYGARFSMHLHREETLWMFLPFLLAIGLSWGPSLRRRLSILAIFMFGAWLLACLRVTSICIAGAYSRNLATIIHNMVWPVAVAVLVVMIWWGWWKANFEMAENGLYPQPARAPEEEKRTDSI